MHFIVRAWAQVSFLHGLCKNSLSTACPAWPDSPAGQGWGIDSVQTDEEDDPGECMVCTKNDIFFEIMLNTVKLCGYIK